MARAIPDLRERRLQAELMDAPELDRDEHGRALAGLRRINWISATDYWLWRALRPRARAASARGHSLRVLDVACGGGEVAIGAALRARREGLDVRLSLCDRAAPALETATRRAREARVNLEMYSCDAIQGLPEGEWDVAMCTLFLHHLARAEALRLLRGMTERSAWVVVDDLERGRLGWLASWIGSRMVTRSGVVHHDALRSVEGAWTRGEMRELAREAGLGLVGLETHWPFRMMLQGRGERNKSS